MSKKCKRNLKNGTHNFTEAVKPYLNIKTGEITSVKRIICLYCEEVKK